MQGKEFEIKNKILLYKTLASILKSHRKELGKSVYKLSAEISLEESVWNKIERVESLDPSLTTIWKIAEALDIYPDELIREVREKLGEGFSLSDLK